MANNEPKNRETNMTDHRIKHGDSTKKSPYWGLYNSYRDMISRCTNKNHKHYNIWGGRGITICNEWLEDYQNFKKWALNYGWKQGLTIDRIDSNGIYEPLNCRWIDRKEQSLNLHNTNLYECNGRVFSQRHIIEFLWTLKVGDEVCIKKLKCNEIKVGNPYHHNHRNHLSK